MAKKRILMSGEATYIVSGFGKYGSEVMKRLYETGKYELAEFSSYAKISDRRTHEIPWKIYCNSVDHADPRFAEYESHPRNAYGMWRYERVLLDFKPDIVWSFRDPQMSEHEGISPYRPYYYRVSMPTIDCIPQNSVWMEDYRKCDALFAYTDWGVDVLRRESNNRLNVICSAPPGVDQYTFFPVKDKKKHRISHGFEPDTFIVGTIMRNQSRKLFPDLIDAFKVYLKLAKDHSKELYDKSYLYLHTSYPDKDCWHIPNLIKNSGIGHKILFTYVCRSCSGVFTAFFKDAISTCVHCGKQTAVLPSVAYGVSDVDLRNILNCFDAYAQYSTNEGFGMPQVEAAACGLPVFAVDYSAMEDVVRKVEGIPIEVQRYFYDHGSGIKALPNNDDFALKLLSYAIQSDEQKAKKTKKIRQAVEKHYTWDGTAKIWEDFFDSVELTGLQGKWNDKSYRYYEPNLQYPEGLTNSQFIEWACTEILQKPERAYQLAGRSLLEDLNYGRRIVGIKTTPFDKQSVINILMNEKYRNDHCEQARCGLLPLSNDDYIQFANRKR